MVSVQFVGSIPTGIKFFESYSYSVSSLASLILFITLLTMLELGENFSTLLLFRTKIRFISNYTMKLLEF